MKGLYLVEPVVALYAFSAYLTYPLVLQYVYRRLWQQLTNSTYPVSDNTSTCAGDGRNHTYFQEVQERASLFSLYSQVLSAVPSLLVTLLLVAYSDRAGRKVAIVLPLAGTLLYTLSLLAVSYLNLNVYLLVGATLLSALFGGLGTFLGGCFAYVADLSGGRRMTLRIAALDMMIGLLSGAASLSTGYFVRAAGFDGPFLTSAACQVLVLLYAVFILEETVTPRDAGAADPDGRSAVRQMFSAIYRMFAGVGPKRRRLLVLLIFVFASFSFAHMGGFSLLVLYELNEPLCWTEILIGYGTALSATVFLFSFAGVAAFTYCGAPRLLVVLMGILSLAVGMTVVAFSKTTLLIFLARVPMFLSVMPFSVLRSMMSKIIRKSEQGALFALLSFAEVLTANVSAAVFNTVYAATVARYPAFVFLLAAGLCVIPTALLGVVCAMGAEVAAEDEAAADD
ncbi:lysosomal proton-coupled steroid conjugate and bile acid symporter SLC46A3 [Phycodurus eques]|uniref:lysosomal proton-coupled steroid conjugate and bile acid symporter SLC46A3 n=1 Tax=Phycodurus eques TaxID=693459 RepID=UPI002ACE856A|nr:lysosomal proton-coupled steroid conjugate and bile acid symporter SLC46A3 [Phycodurus eques]XP_061559190.1 lysosomal proton-coupled steroid conjugate and bile acid symporter SLC46A3 [Phycodurus eques]XP_061559191.1 lysosomal proton-coupled steroid conjugate and bile acid symporter SLC46A3 [Phycodurus eques]XP_061559192.1 lysosomal proton-coupled steroid conjugate and bile acid symporter SLC46A3 [Phycodurus eques]